MPTSVRPEFYANVRLLPTSEGGRAGAISYGEYRGVLQLESEAFSFRFFVESERGLELGTSAELGFQLLVPEAGLPLLPVGTHFKLWEGKLIGNGIVTRLQQNG